jgi:predicted O-methyltransferase YrrM
MNDDLSFCPTLETLLREQNFIGRSGKEIRNASVSTANNLVTLRNLQLALKPKATLEIGLCYGGSCLVFTASHKELLGKPARQHTAIDPFQHEYWDDVGLLVTEKAGLSDYLDFIAAKSCFALPELLKRKRTYDLVYIDGSHLYEDVFIDLYFVARLLNPDGVVAFDDSADPHVAKVLNFVRTNMREILKPIDLAPYRADRGKSLKYKVAKVANRIQLTAFTRTAKPADREWNVPFADF